MVTVDLAICFEDGGNCLVNVNIFEKVKLSKQICVWAAQFLHPGKNINIFGVLVSTKQLKETYFIFAVKLS